MADDWASSGGIKIERAKEHINDLKTACDAFLNSGAYERFIDDNGKPGLRVHGDPPLRLGAIAGEAIHNLRSALDILWRHVMYPGGGGASDRKIQFPIYDSAEEFKAARSRPIKGARKAALTILAAVKPYKGGSNALWRLHHLDIADKHHVLLTVGVAFSQVITGPLKTVRATVAIPRGLAIPVVLDVLDAPQQGDVVSPSGAVPQPDQQSQVAVEIALSEPGIIQGEPIIPTLVQFTDAVESVVEAFTRAGLLA